MTRKFRTTGFSLIELLVAISIFTIVAFIATRFQADIFIQGEESQRRIAAEQEARTTLKNMIAEIRSAAPSNIGDYPIVLASSSAITFFSDIDNDGLQEQVRYYLLGRTLRKSVIKPTGAPYQYLPANEKVSYEVNDIINVGGVVFQYYDRNYTGSSTPLVYPVNIADIRVVKVIVTIDANPARAPEPITFESQVSIRNLKDNL
jgi:prepilin-type N-terminal cleavage/methylation domain-containing protein